MENFKSKFSNEKKDNDIIFSESVKAGKRIYYLDVKKSKNDDLFLTITESKKIVTGAVENTQVSYEKHKIFLYPEDFEKFTSGLAKVVSFIKEQSGGALPQREEKFDEFLADLNAKIEELA